MFPDCLFPIRANTHKDRSQMAASYNFFPKMAVSEMAVSCYIMAVSYKGHSQNGCSQNGCTY